MIVCAHGDVSKFCEDGGLDIVDHYDGDLEKYHGSCHIVVTDQDLTPNQYYYLQKVLLARGVQLISTKVAENPVMSLFLAYNNHREQLNNKQKRGGRQPFGFRRVNGTIERIEENIKVARRILELRDSGATLRDIQADKGVHHPDGREISISTIQVIVKNRKIYE